MKTKDGLLKAEDVLLKTKDCLLKTEDILLKTRDGPSENRKLLTHNLTNVPTHPYTDIRLGRLQYAQPMAELKNKRYKPKQGKENETGQDKTKTKHYEAK